MADYGRVNTIYGKDIMEGGVPIMEGEAQCTRMCETNSCWRPMPENRFLKAGLDTKAWRLTMCLIVGAYEGLE